MNLEKTMSKFPALEACRLHCGTNTGTWLPVRPSIVNGKDQGDQEWRNSPFLGYGIDTPDVPPNCDAKRVA